VKVRAVVSWVGEHRRLSQLHVEEKRDVLNVFWRTNVDATSRIVVAAAQYGYYAVISLVVVMAEVALILWVGLEHNALVAA